MDHDPPRANIARVTRRQFFGTDRSGRRRGGAWRRCSGRTPRSRRCRDALPAKRRGGPAGLPGLPHFAPKAKRVVYLWQGGGPSHVDLFDHKPSCKRLARQDMPDSVRGTTRLSTMTERLRASGRCSRRSSRSSSTASRAWSSARCCRTSGRSPTSSASSAVDAHRGRQPRARRHVLHDRRAGARPAEHGGVADLRPGQRDRRPAGVRRHDLARQGQDLRPALLRLLLGQRVPAQPVPGRAVPQHGRPGALPGEPAGHEPRVAPRRCSTTSPA